MSPSNFQNLTLPKAMLHNLVQLGYKTMTPVQEASLPLALKGSDVIAKAKTGSGKTASFGIPMLCRLDPKNFRVQGLVLCPTRELADQVAKELRRLARFTHNIKVITLCGGVPFGPQLGSLEHGAHIVVGTPGRIQQHLRKGSLKLQSLKTFVLDEADRMLDMGFQDDIRNIASQIPTRRQTLLFSATYPDNLEKIGREFTRDPGIVDIEQTESRPAIDQFFYAVPRKERVDALVTALSSHEIPSAVIFCNTKRECSEVAEALWQRNIYALALHGDKEQRERDQVLVRFSNGSCPILVATDVAARGLDISELPAVINFELPRDPDVYVHRIGRTGRAGSKGIAINFCEVREQYKLDRIAEYADMECQLTELATDFSDKFFSLEPQNATLQIDGGRKQKLRPGDILGALTGEAGLDASVVGKIDCQEYSTFIAIRRDVANRAQKNLSKNKIKGRTFKVRRLK